MNQKRVGILLSYVNLILSMGVNIFLTPLMITSLGDVDYSLYKVMQSFAGPLSMFHLGISTVVTRSIVQFGSDETYTRRDKQNTMALTLLASGIMAFLVSLAGIGMCSSIPTLYGENYSAEKVLLGQRIFLAFMASTVFHMLTDAFSGCMVGHEKFVVTSSLQIFRTLTKMVMWYVFLKLGMGVFAITCVDLAISLLTFLFSFGYAVLYLHETPRLYYFDRAKLMEILTFGAAIFLQAIVNQVNNNVANMILGVYVTDKSIITMYSSALTIYMLYNSLISVVANFFLPNASRLVQRKATGAELTDFVISPGRFQAILAVACILGFSLFGRNFIIVWIGEQYINAYYVTLMLMIPVTVPLVENTMISVLDASLKRIYRSVTLVIMALLNVVLSLCLISVMGFWGVALGTVISLIIGHGFLMNIYYSKVFGLQIKRMFFSIFKGILPAGLVASIPCIPLALLLPDTLLCFAVKCCTFILFYGLFLLLFGLKSSEKDIIFKMLHIRRRGSK